LTNDGSQEQEKRNRLLTIIIVLAAIAACLIGYGIFSMGSAGSADAAATARPAIASAGAQVKPSESSEESVQVSAGSYTAYHLDGISFQFVIAKIHVHSAQPINLSLSHFHTDEGIALNDIDSYVAELEKNSLYLGRQNVWFSIISQETDADTNIFIPVKSLSAASVTVTADTDQISPMTFSLKDPKGTSDDLLYQAEDVITDGKTYQMTVSEAREITGSTLYQTVGGEEQEYLLPSTTKIYAFRVEAVSLWGDSITIASAQYVPSGSSESFDAMDSSIRAEKYANIIGREISEKDSGYLLFYAYDPDDHPITYSGVLKLTLQGSSDPIAVNVSLN